MNNFLSTRVVTRLSLKFHQSDTKVKLINSISQLTHDVAVVKVKLDCEKINVTSRW